MTEMCERDKEADIDTAYSTVKCNLPHAESVNSTKKRKPTTQLSQPIPKRPSAKDKFITALLHTKADRLKRKHQTRQPRKIKLGNSKYVTIRKYNGRPKVNIRTYSRDCYGKLLSTKRGLLLTTDEWSTLKESLSTIDQRLAERTQAMDKEVKSQNH